ncbi:hypothetical protein K438DRAFT_1938951 [Mycena galopus ATCC 62051]|nr:hypothetical protein K438DRAFT_1938951 [Mycena galopus ATCC 62051]
MSDDESYCSSSRPADPNDPMEHKTVAPQEEFDPGRDERRRKRKRMNLPVSSPIKGEDLSPDLADISRSTALIASRAVSDFFFNDGALDSQAGDATYVDNLLDAHYQEEHWEQSQQIEFEDGTQPEYTEETQEHANETQYNTDHELSVQIQQLRTRFNLALQERDDALEERDQYNTALKKARTDTASALEVLQKWEDAAMGASALINLASAFRK